MREGWEEPLAHFVSQVIQIVNTCLISLQTRCNTHTFMLKAWWWEGWLVLLEEGLAYFGSPIIQIKIGARFQSKQVHLYGAHQSVRTLDLARFFTGLEFKPFFNHIIKILLFGLKRSELESHVMGCSLYQTRLIKEKVLIKEKQLILC